MIVLAHKGDMVRKSEQKLLKKLSPQSLSDDSDMLETYKKHICTRRFLNMSSEFGNLRGQKLSPRPRIKIQIFTFSSFNFSFETLMSVTMLFSL